MDWRNTPPSQEFKDFLSGKDARRSAWIVVCPGLEFYLRTCGSKVDLANMQATRPGGGLLSAFLPVFEFHVLEYNFTRIKVENILNPRLIPFFERHKYQRIPDFLDPPSYYKEFQ